MEAKRFEHIYCFDDSVDDLIVNHCSTHLFVVGDDGFLIYDISTKELIGKLDGGYSRISLSNSDRMAVLRSYNRMISLVKIEDLATPVVIKSVHTHYSFG